VEHYLTLHFFLFGNTDSETGMLYSVTGFSEAAILFINNSSAPIFSSIAPQSACTAGLYFNNKVANIFTFSGGSCLIIIINLSQASSGVVPGI